MKKNINIYQKGFSLIEMIVVITVIAILVGIAAFALMPARGNARDARRKSDIETIRAALALYYADCHNYPNPSSNRVPSPLTATCVSGTSTYLQETPRDPRNSTGMMYR